MPATLFEKLYEAFAIRKEIEELLDLKNAMISGMYANSNYDDDKGTRMKSIQEINESFAHAIAVLNGEEPAMADIDLNSDPLFAAMKLPPEIDDGVKPMLEASERYAGMEVDQL